MEFAVDLYQPFFPLLSVGIPLTWLHSEYKWNNWKWFFVWQATLCFKHLLSKYILKNSSKSIHGILSCLERQVSCHVISVFLALSCEQMQRGEIRSFLHIRSERALYYHFWKQLLYLFAYLPELNNYYTKSNLVYLKLRWGDCHLLVELCTHGLPAFL